MPGAQERCAFAGDHHVGAERYPEPGAGRRAVDGRQNGLRHANDPVKDLVPPVGQVTEVSGDGFQPVLDVGDLLEIETRAERLSGAGDQDRACPAVVLGPHQRIECFLNALKIHGVGVLRQIEGQLGDPFLDLV